MASCGFDDAIAWNTMRAAKQMIDKCAGQRPVCQINEVMARFNSENRAEI
jgi:hypothetical protein